MHTICVFGCGTIGSSWAGFFASKGLSVRMYDVSEKARADGRARALHAIDGLVAHGLCDGAAAERGKLALRVCADPAEALAGVEFIQESVFERYDVKRATHEIIERHAPSQAIIASSTSGLLASKMQEGLKHPQRFLIAHPFNPPHLIPLVELVSGPETAPAVLKQCYDFYAALQKVPVVLNKEVPGHLANRLAAAVWREAIDLVARGVASVEDVDKALHAGPGLRWAFMGQHLTYHLNGGEGGYAKFFEHFGPALEVYFADLAKWDRIPDAAKKEVVAQTQASLHGRSTADLVEWRDERLAILLRALHAPKECVDSR